MDKTGGTARHGLLRRNLIARMHLVVSAVLGLGCAYALPSGWELTTRALIGWNAAIWLYAIWGAVTLTGSTRESMRSRAEKADESRFAVLVISILAAAASFVAIIAQLGMAKEMQGFDKALHLGLAIVTILGSWTFIHLTFAQHYAHEFFVERDKEKKLPPDQRGGLQIPGCEKPDFGDFLYFSFVIGVACQTADIAITSKTMRRVALVHCVLSFFFNTTILALTINIGAGLV